MIIFYRKFAENAIQQAKEVDVFEKPSWYEDQFVQTMERLGEDKEFVEKGLGEMVLYVTHLLEMVRRTDPAYEAERLRR